ncbi:PilZ domain-containing protein [Rhizobium halophilum]|uniref:PilZ domain-containing protein n=1 Tax=Rhizobium halophilum TaxID=2846852 RepID=UPI00374D58E7
MHHFKTAIPADGKKPRRAARRRTCAEVLVTYMGTETRGLIRDLSTTGAAVELRGYFQGMVGSSVTLRCDGLCTVEAKVRWYRNCRIGVEFDCSSNTAAKVHAYFKYFHKDALVAM